MTNRAVLDEKVEYERNLDLFTLLNAASQELWVVRLGGVRSLPCASLQAYRHADIIVLSQ